MATYEIRPSPFDTIQDIWGELTTDSAVRMDEGDKAETWFSQNCSNLMESALKGNLNRDQLTRIIKAERAETKYKQKLAATGRDLFENQNSGELDDIPDGMSQQSYFRKRADLLDKALRIISSPPTSLLSEDVSLVSVMIVNIIKNHTSFYSGKSEQLSELSQRLPAVVSQSIRTQ